MTPKLSLKKIRKQASEVVSFWCSEAELHTQVEGMNENFMFETLLIQTLFLACAVKYGIPW